MLGDRGGRGEAGGLHADEVNRLRHVGIARNHEIRDALATGWHQLRTQTGIAKLQVALIDFRQQSFCALRESSDRQTITLVVVFSFDIFCGRPQEKSTPESFREVHTEAEAVS